LLDQTFIRTTYIY